MGNAIPKTSELEQAVKDCLVADSYFSGLSAAIEEANPGTSDLSFVVLDDGTMDNTVKRHLRECGVCVVVYPVIAAAKRDQSGPEFVLDCEVIVKVQVEPARNKDTEHGGLNVKPLDVVMNVLRALCNRTRVQGGEFFKAGQTPFELSKFDNGILVYDVFVTKETRQ